MILDVIECSVLASVHAGFSNFVRMIVLILCVTRGSRLAAMVLCG